VFRTEASSSTINSFCNRIPQYHGKARAFTGLARDFHAAAVVGHDLLHDGQSDAGAHFARLLGALGAG